MLNIDREFEGETCVLRVADRLDVKSAKAAEETFEQVSTESKDIVLDLEELDYVASAGLRVFRRLYKDVSELPPLGPRERVAFRRL